jgi:hypothetical protein
MLNDTPDRPSDADIGAAAIDAAPAEPPRPALILLAADDEVVCVDDVCLPGDATQ